MSAFDEKKRKQQEARTARESQQRKEDQHSRITYILIAVLFVAVAVVTFVWKSNIFQKQAAAATINNQSYNAAEVSYYYGAAYQMFMSQYGSYASMFGLNPEVPLEEQECSMMADQDDEEDDDDNVLTVQPGHSWRDYFVQQGLQQMSNIHALVDKADAEGFQYPDDLQQQVSDTLATMETTALSNGYGSLKQYLAAVYGPLVSKSVAEKEMLLSLKAESYSNSYADSLSYTDDQLEDAYNAAKNTYDMVDYEYLQIKGSADSTTDDDGNTVEPTEEESAAAMKKAKELADDLLAAYQNGESLADLADEHSDEGVSHTANEEGSYSSSVVMDWLFNADRKNGDAEILEDESGSQYYVAVFNKRFRPEFNTADVRHILIAPEEGKLSDDDDGYEDEQAQLKADAKAKAESLLEQWKSGDATEDSFAALAKEESADGGSAADGGLITGISKLSSYVENFLNWSIDSHQPGDTGIVESDYGYHIMYYVGQGNPYWKVQAENNLRNEDYSSWYTEQTEGYTAEHQDGIKYVG